MTVNGTKLAVRTGPFVPYRDSVLLKILYIGVSGNEPEQLVNDGLKVDFFCGEKRETVLQVEAHLVSENALRPGTRTVFLHDAVFPNMSQEVQILFHGGKFKNFNYICKY